MGARESYRELILENIEYDFWKNSDRVDHEMLDEITELIVDTVCSARKDDPHCRGRLSGGGGQSPGL